MTRILVFLLTCLTVTGALAQAGAPSEARKQQLVEELKKRFAAADANGDGKLTKDEANGKMPRVYQNFDAIDKNKKGYVTLQEIMAYGTERSASRPQTR